MRKRAIASIVVLAVSVLALAAFSLPMSVSADAPGNPGAGCASETKYYGTINGGIYFQTSALNPGGWMQYPSLSATFDDVPAKEKVKVARLYTGIWGGSPGKGGNYTITVNGNSSQKYQYCDPCPQAGGCEPWQALRCNAINTSTSEPECHHYVTGCNVNFISYDVFNDIQTGTNSVAVTTEKNDSCPRTGWDGRVYLIALLIVYENESMPEMTYWVNEGAPYMEKDSACDGPEDHFNISFYFNGTHISEPDKVKYWTLGFPRVANSPTMEINGNDIGQPDYKESPAGYDVFYRWDNISPSYLDPNSNFFYYYDPEPFYERVYSAVLAVQGQEAVAKPDLIVTEVNAYHWEGAKDWSSPWFNLTNYVDVTVKNNCTADADSFNVSLYADGEPIGEQRISNLSGGSSETLVFEWKPEGEDPLGWTDTAEGAIFSYADTSKEYTLRAVADEDEEVSESNVSNNNMTVSETVTWNGYMGDEPLENYAHGKVRGGLIYTTGDGMYHSGEAQEPGTKYGTYYEVNYDLEIPGDTKLARLYFYYTWAKPGGKAPKVGATIKTPSDDIHVLNMEKSYSETKGSGAWNLPWGTYAYDITEYVTESGTYVVNITNLNDPDNFDDRFADRYSFAAPAILLVYENETMRERDYWINEGADVLIGGRRGDGGFLSLEECINNATFSGSVDLSKVENATLGVVSPWSDKPPLPKNVLYFNGIELGRAVYDNGWDPIGDISLDGIRMTGSGGAQVGVNLSDVTDYLNASVNIAGQGDNGDCMMPVNALLVVEYKEEAPPTLFLIYGWVNYSTGEPVFNPNVTITNLNTSEVFIAETNASSNYYQVLTSSRNVSAGNVLHFNASDNKGNFTDFNHTVTEEEMNKGGFLQNVTISLPVIQMPDLLVTEVKTRTVCFTKYVDVTVKNNGTADADVFNVSLYADGELIEAQPITNLSSGSNETLVFEWKPEDPLGWTDIAEGAILTSTSNPRTYTLRAVADEDDRIAESNETNNNMTASEIVEYNGYMADDPLENYAHGKLRGGLIYTTGDGGYHSGESECPGTKYGTYSETHYDLEIPRETKLARLYFYYTWAKPGGKAPKLGITLKTPSEDIYALNMEKSYNDMKAHGGWNLAWGTYAYDITEYVTESGTYVVNITNLNSPDTPYVGNDTRFAHHYSFAAPAVLVVYANETMPEREYWVNEGADITFWGTSPLATLECCTNNATFEGSIDLSKVKNATLGVVSPWGAADKYYLNALYFNGIELGWDVYDLCGYGGPDDISLDGIHMWCIYGRTQVGMNLSDVTSYLNASVNIAGQGDNGDCMMPSNAFLVITYKEEEKPAVSISTDKTSYTAGEKMHLGLDVKNPLDSAQRVRFAIYLEMPTGGTFTLIDKTVTLPAGLDYSNPDFMVFRLPDIPAGTYTWHAIIEDAVTGEIICEDAAEWEFVLGETPTADITEALEQTTVVLDFDK